MLSVIIPMFNEGVAIRENLRHLNEFLRRRNGDFEIIAVDDGSTDDTVAAVMSLTKELPVQLIQLPENFGKGAAVKRGVQAARGHIILFIDADLPYDLNAILEAECKIRDGVDLVIGDRTLAGSRMDTRPSLTRQVTGKGLSKLLALTLFYRRNLPDTQCGLKIFRGEVARELFGKLETKRFGFDIEILHAALRRNYRIERVAVRLKKNGHSRVRVVHDSFDVLGVVVRLMRLRRWQESSCPNCRHTRAVIRQRFGDYTVVECEHCHLRFLSPFPDHAVLTKLYEDSYFTSSEETTTGYADYENSRDTYLATFRRRLDQFADRVAHRQRILDLGCGYGYLLEAARGYFSEGWGCDLSDHALKIVAQKGFHTIPGPLEDQADVPADFFDAVSMDDFIEHITDPHRMIEAVYRAVKTGGVVAITTPNTQSFLARISGRRWVSYKIPEHVVYYNPQTLSQLLEDHGFSIEKIISAGQYVTLGFLMSRLKKLFGLSGGSSVGVESGRFRRRTLYIPSGSMTIIVRKV